MVSTRELASALRVLRQETDRGVAARLAGTLLLTVAGGLLSGLAPLALKALVDTLSGAHEAHTRMETVSALVLGAIYLAALSGARLLVELRPVLMGSAEQRLYARLRRRFFAHLLELPLAFHVERQTGATVQILQQAIAGYQIVIFNLVNSVVPVLVELVTVTFVLATLGQPALMAAFAGTALAYFAVLSIGNRLTEVARAVSMAGLETHAVLADGLLNVETIKSFGAEAIARDRFAKATGDLELRWARLHRERTRVGLALMAAFTLSIAASLAVAVHAVAHGTLTLGGFVLANVYMLQVARPLEMLGAATRDLSQAVQFIRPLLDVLDESAGRPDGPRRSLRLTGRCLSPISEAAHDAVAAGIRRLVPSISFRNVHFAYDDGKPVLHEFSLDIAAGRSVAIVGASGSGKSSLIRLLLRLYEPQHGCILVNDVAIDTLPLGDLRSMMAFVSQDTVLFNDTIAWNIGIGDARASRNDIERAARVAGLYDFVSALPCGYDTVVGERGLKLSGGERQRIAIARAVLKRPQVYVFDEATSMLDSLTEIAILRRLQEVSAGCTTISVAHRLSTVQQADQIVVLDAGQVAERGSHEALLARDGAYARMWHAQSRGGMR